MAYALWHVHWVRVVALTCSNTEIVCALGCEDLLVGVDEHSDYPADVVARLPRVGPDLGIDIERVAELKPDLVLASLTVPGHEHIVDALREKGLPFIAPEPTSIGDVFEDVRLIADRLGVPERAEPLVARMRAELTPAQAPAVRPKILVEWWPRPVIVPGRDSWVNQLLDVAGATNPLGERDVKSTPITDDEAVAMNPDAVVISWCGVKREKYRPSVVYEREAWSNIPAVKCRRVYCVSEAYLGRPSPRLVDGARALRSIVADLSAGRSAPVDGGVR